MANYKALKLTEKGKRLFAKTCNGSTIRFTKLAAGSGIYTADEDYSARSELKEKRQEFSIRSMSIENEKYVKIKSRISNYSLAEGYEITEIGIYALDPVDGEVLYAIMLAEDNASDYLPAYTDVAESTIEITLLLFVANADNVRIEINSNMYVYHSEYSAKVEELEQMIRNGIAGSGASLLEVATPVKLGGVKPVKAGGGMTLMTGIDSEGRLFTENPVAELSLAPDENGNLALFYRGVKIGAGVSINIPSTGEGSGTGSEESGSESGGIISGENTEVAPDELPPEEIPPEPTEYTQMAHTFSENSSVCIDTGIPYITNQTDIEFEFTRYCDSYYSLIETSKTKMNKLYVRVEMMGELHARIGAWSDKVYNVDDKTQKHKIRINKGNVYFDNAFIWKYPDDYQVFTTDEMIRIGQNCYFHGCTIRQNDILVREFIPVKDAQGVKCIYDKVNSQYYYPPEGYKFK